LTPHRTLSSKTTPGRHLNLHVRDVQADVHIQPRCPSCCTPREMWPPRPSPCRHASRAPRWAASTVTTTPTPARAPGRRWRTPPASAWLPLPPPSSPTRWPGQPPPPPLFSLHHLFRPDHFLGRGKVAPCQTSSPCFLRSCVLPLQERWHLSCHPFACRLQWALLSTSVSLLTCVRTVPHPTLTPRCST